MLLKVWWQTALVVALGLSRTGSLFGQDTDPASSLRVLRTRAEQGEAAAQHKLAVMYYKGQDATQDYAEAARWYRKVAEQGDADGQTMLGIMYDKGQGVMRDVER